MATITFDTLKFANRLKSAGVASAHAEAEAEALVSVLSEAIEQQLATKEDIRGLEKSVKADIADVKSDLVRVERELKAENIPMQRDLFVLKWMMGMMIGGITALVLKAFFPV